MQASEKSPPSISLPGDLQVIVVPLLERTQSEQKPGQVFLVTSLFYCFVSSIALNLFLINPEAGRAYGQADDELAATAGGDAVELGVLLGSHAVTVSLSSNKTCNQHNSVVLIGYTELTYLVAAARKRVVMMVENCILRVGKWAIDLEDRSF